MGQACYRRNLNEPDYNEVNIDDCNENDRPPTMVKIKRDKVYVAGWHDVPPVSVVREFAPENDYACWQAGQPLVSSQVLGWRVFECLIASDDLGDCDEVRKMVSALYQPFNFLILPAEADQRFRAAEVSLSTAIDAYDEIRSATSLSDKWSTRSFRFIETLDFKNVDAVYIANTILKHYPTLQILRTVTGDALLWEARIDNWVRMLEFLSRLD